MVSHLLLLYLTVSIATVTAICFDCDLQESLESNKSAADEVTQQLSADMQPAKQAVIHLLNKAKSLTQRKADMCEHMYQQKQRLSGLSVNTIADSSADPGSLQAPVYTLKEGVKDNDEQLAACRKLFLAFQATRDARTQLQALSIWSLLQLNA